MEPDCYQWNQTIFSRTELFSVEPDYFQWNRTIFSGTALFSVEQTIINYWWNRTIVIGIELLYIGLTRLSSVEPDIISRM